MIVPLRVKKDVLKALPDKLEEVRYVQMGKEQQKLFCCDLSLCFDGYKGESAKREAVMDLIHTLIDEGHRAHRIGQKRVVTVYNGYKNVTLLMQHPEHVIGEQKLDALLRVVEVDADQPADLLQPVGEGAPVNVQLL